MIQISISDVQVARIVFDVTWPVKEMLNDALDIKYITPLLRHSWAFAVTIVINTHHKKYQLYFDGVIRCSL